MGQRYEGYFKSTDGAELFFQNWKVDEPRGTIVVTHGLAEHSDCYDEFATLMSQDQWQVYAWDLRGHGRSVGKRGYIGQFDEFITDYQYFLSQVAHEVHAQRPLVLFGHSLGGLITLKYALMSPTQKFSAICVSSPALGLVTQVPALKHKLVEFAAEWFPKITLFNEINYRDLIRDETLIRSYASDPLRHDKISPRLYLGLLESARFVMERAGQLTAPLLMQVSGSDAIVSTAAAVAFFEGAASGLKKLHIYDDSLHEIFNDLDKVGVFQDLRVFLQQVERIHGEARG